MRNRKKMMMPRSPADASQNLPATIRRQIRTEANISYLRSLPAFRVDAELPSDLQEMLDAIDEAAAERDRSAKERSQ